ncbi:MAG TPA: glycosyltransferase family 87 protein [Opitutaceae bacterium]|jgi:hypothetical protein
MSRAEKPLGIRALRPFICPILLAALAALYLGSYLSHPQLPGNSTQYPLGWFGWFDQGCYLKEAHAIASGHLSRDTFIYPIGYPALGALLVHWVPRHPFLLINLACVLAIATLCYRLAREVMGDIGAALFIAVFVVTHATLLRESLVVPWNTIPTFLLFWSAVWLCLTRNDFYAAVSMSALAAAAYLMRPADAGTMAPMLIWAVIRLPNWRERFVAAGVGLGLVMLAWGFIACLNLRIFGSTTSGYDTGRLITGFGSYPFWTKVHLLLVDFSPPFWTDSAAVLFQYPWLFLAVPGAVAAALRWRGSAIAVLASVACFFVLYVNYNDLWPTNIFKFTLIHYWCWIFPLVGLWVVDAILHLRGRWAAVAWGAAAFSVIAGTTIELRCRPEFQRRALQTALVVGAPTDRIRVRAGGRELVNGPDYGMAEEMDQGSRLWLAPSVRPPVAVSPGRLEQLGSLVFGLGFAPDRWIFPLTRFPGVLRLRTLPRSQWRDSTGPLGVPDGFPDVTFAVSAPDWILRRAAQWDVEAEPSGGHWLNRPNHWGLWLLKVTKSGDGRRLVECPDTGQIVTASELKVTVYDSDHRLLWNELVALQR